MTSTWVKSYVSNGLQERQTIEEESKKRVTENNEKITKEYSKRTKQFSLLKAVCPLVTSMMADIVGIGIKGYRSLKFSSLISIRNIYPTTVSGFESLVHPLMIDFRSRHPLKHPSRCFIKCWGVEWEIYGKNDGPILKGKKECKLRVFLTYGKEETPVFLINGDTVVKGVQNLKKVLGNKIEEAIKHCGLKDQDFVHLLFK